MTNEKKIFVTFINAIIETKVTYIAKSFCISLFRNTTCICFSTVAVKSIRPPPLKPCIIPIFKQKNIYSHVASNMW